MTHEAGRTGLRLGITGHVVADWLYVHFGWVLLALLVNLLVLPLFGLMVYLAQRGSNGGAHLSAETKKSVEIGTCFVGLCLCFVSYGIVQEYIMTQKYSVGGHFPSSVFLVLANRTFALFMLLPLLLVRGERLVWDGWYKCAGPALTLMTSSWCQHESLRYVSFPTQIVFKSSKIVPTMAVGKCVLGRDYGWKEYLVAVMVTLGVAGFSLSMEEPSASEAARATMTFGVCLMLAFLLCDALTSNGEKRVFTAHPHVSPLQMFFVMAVFSWVYSAVSVFMTKGFGPIFAFLMANPNAVMHVAALSVAASVGQVLIFYIVKHHGPVVFSVMMTIRQMISVATSALVFGHTVSPTALVCALAVFVALFIQTYLHHQRAEGRERVGGRAPLPKCAGEPGYGATLSNGSNPR